jgi:hypothetical protein
MPRSETGVFKSKATGLACLLPSSWEQCALPLSTSRQEILVGRIPPSCSVADDLARVQELLNRTIMRSGVRGFQVHKNCCCAI